MWALWAQLLHSPNALAWIPLGLAALALIGSLILTQQNSSGKAFTLHFAGIAFAVVFIFSAMAPDVMRSSIDEAYSLTIQQAASADTTLLIVYTIWGYRVFSKRINADAIDPDEGGLHPTKVRDSAQPEAAIGY